ncbi:FeoA family protein [Gynuella sp.]|uniref:FeoA family protein n=1 Tax=Gynuella sp. TaxID=2969146 RepID=UPI003D0AC8D7
MVLSQLQKGHVAKIHRVTHPHGETQEQLISLGFDPGETVQLMMKAPFGNPMQIKVGSTLIAIHSTDAQHVHLCESECKDHAV